MGATCTLCAHANICKRHTFTYIYNTHTLYNLCTHTNTHTRSYRTYTIISHIKPVGPQGVVHTQLHCYHRYTYFISTQAAKVLSDCKDHDNKKVSKGTILYNLTTFTTKVRMRKKRGIKGVSSFGVVHKFVEGEEVRFSTRQLDTKCNLVEIYDIFKGPLRARIFCEGGPDLKQNDVIVFEEKEERTFLVARTLNNQEPSRSLLSILTDLTGIQVCIYVSLYDYSHVHR